MKLFDTSQLERPVSEITEAVKSGKKVKTKLGTRLNNCSKAIGEIKKDTVYHYITAGTWSSHELLHHILKQTGKADVYICTWSMSQPGAEYIINLYNEGYINRMFGLFDWRIKVRAANALQLVKNNFSRVYLTNCHAKVTVITNDNFNVSIVGSANYTNNPRIEAGTIDTNKQIANFHKDWIMKTIDKENPLKL